ncbi:MAG: hypothetical protein LBF56_01715 [Holosporales bacterium]|jgi:hypothetical protein|nr:hypothetical protein [Holosporales bacterium]
MLFFKTLSTTLTICVLLSSRGVALTDPDQEQIPVNNNLSSATSKIQLGTTEDQPLIDDLRDISRYGSGSGLTLELGEVTRNCIIDVETGKCTGIQNIFKSFDRDHPQFKYGVEVIETIYNTETPSAYLGVIKPPNAFLTGVLDFFKRTTNISCEIVRGISMFNPNDTIWGPLLIGLQSGRTTLSVMSAILASNSARPLLKLATAIHQRSSSTTPQSSEYLVRLCRETNEINLNKILGGAKTIVQYFATQQRLLDKQTGNRVTRLYELIHKLDDGNIFTKILTVGGKVLSSCTNIATGVIITVFGQGSTLAKSMTLVASGLDTAANVEALKVADGAVIFRYLTIAELMFLSDSLLKLLPMTNTTNS